MEATEKKVSHTPGPWGWQRFGDTYSLTAQHGMREIIIGGINHKQMGYPVVGMNLDGILQDVDPEHPNAKLIAAAPELLKALQLISKEREAQGYPVHFHWSKELTQAVEYAIIKATE